MITKITDFLRNVKYGLQNLWKWKSIIYVDRDWDWAFLYRIMAFKMESMADSIETYGLHWGKEVTVEELRECAKRLRRVEQEDYGNGREMKWEIVEKLIEEDEALVYKTMKEKARSWWD